MLIISHWNGRLGNNILQIIRAIHYAYIYKHNTIQFKPHNLLTNTFINIEKNNDNNNNNTNTITDTFFNLKKYNIIDPEPYKMREYFQTYISPIFKIKSNIDLINSSNQHDNMIYIHFRGGDIFSSNPHKAYVQPPLSYYRNIIKDYQNIKLVCEDKSNPCINELLKQTNVDYISNTLEQDLVTLANVSNLIIGFGTFGFLLYLINPSLKNLYIPDFFVNELPHGNWGENINIHVIKIPNYIKVGEWKFNEEQRKIMLEY